jgi:hypothetical protein
MKEELIGMIAGFVLVGFCALYVKLLKPAVVKSK